MPNSCTVSLDPTTIYERLDGETLTSALKPFIKGASRVSADHIAAEAIARLTRQVSGAPSRHPPPTVDQITVKSDRTGWGWIVDAGNLSTPMLDRWLELGTRRMQARPFFFDSARLEQAAHLDRVQNAVRAALSQYGLGDTV